MLCVWGAWIGLGTDAVGGSPKGESQPYCTRLAADECVCQGKVSGPYLLLVRLVVDEPADPDFHDVVSGVLPGAEECTELSHADVSSSTWQEGHSKAPVGVDALEVRQEGVY